MENLPPHTGVHPRHGASTSMKIALSYRGSIATPVNVRWRAAFHARGLTASKGASILAERVRKISAVMRDLTRSIELLR